VLVHKCGYATVQSQAALQALWAAVAEEQLLSDDVDSCNSHGNASEQGIPAAAQHMVIHHLHSWGCPVQLSPPSSTQAGGSQPSSRRLLLALIWLVAKGRVFERALELKSQGCLSSQELLPPYAQASQGEVE
jgi:hypothetical protein